MTPKQEKFCLLVASGIAQNAAYRESYDVADMNDASISHEAVLMMQHEKILKRLTELRKPVIEAARYDLQVAMDEAAEAFILARGMLNPAGMVAAAALRAKLSGLLVDRSEIKHGLLDKETTEDLVEMKRVAQERVAQRRQLQLVQKAG